MIILILLKKTSGVWDRGEGKTPRGRKNAQQGKRGLLGKEPGGDLCISIATLIFLHGNPGENSEQNQRGTSRKGHKEGKWPKWGATMT